MAPGRSGKASGVCVDSAYGTQRRLFALQRIVQLTEGRADEEWTVVQSTRLTPHVWTGGVLIVFRAPVRRSRLKGHYSFPTWPARSLAEAESIDQLRRAIRRRIRRRALGDQMVSRILGVGSNLRS